MPGKKAVRSARLSIDIRPHDRRRLRMAAAQADKTIRDYVWEAVSIRIDRDLKRSGAASEALAHDPVLDELWNNPHDAVYDQH